MRNTQRQSGATLVVSLIMLLVLTLLVVSAIRLGNTNLRVVGNMQVQTETAAATQQAIEQVIDVNNPVDFTTITAPQTVTITTGPVSYDVNVAKPTCGTSVPIFGNELDPRLADDKLCVADASDDIILDQNGVPVPKQTMCNRQQWELQAAVSDNASGAKITQVQGAVIRRYIPTPC